MDVRSLACFVALAEDLHFRRAALRLNMTQPALSQRIRTLEQEVGTALLERDRRHVLLTAAGAAFLEPARLAVANAQKAKSLALRAIRGEVGVLRLGFTVIAFYGMLPQAVRRFRARYPDVAVDLVELNSPSLEARLDSGDIDIGILHPPLATATLVVHPLPAERLVLALPESHSLAGLAVIAIEQLAGQPFLIAPRAIGPSIYDRVAALFREHGVSPTIIQEVTPMPTLAGLVATGAGMGFVTRGIASLPRPGAVFREVTPEPPNLPMAAAWRGPDLSATGKRFLDIVDELADSEP